jgi:hypothetical protein
MTAGSKKNGNGNERNRKAARLCRCDSERGAAKEERAGGKKSMGTKAMQSLVHLIEPTTAVSSTERRSLVSIRGRMRTAAVVRRGMRFRGTEEFHL